MLSKRGERKLLPWIEREDEAEDDLHNVKSGIGLVGPPHEVAVRAAEERLRARVAARRKVQVQVGASDAEVEELRRKYQERAT